MADKKIIARKGRGFYAPRFSRNMYRFARFIAPLYMRMTQGVAKIVVSDMETLYQAILRFQRDETRLIMLFRHVAVPDGPVVVQTVSRELARWCRKNRKPLPRFPHTHFLYGKDVLNWAGALARFAFPRMGGVPVVNGRVDKESQSTIRRILTQGRFPLAFAPEGQITYHQFKMYPLAPGAGTLAAWAHRDLGTCAANAVEVLPIAITYRHGNRLEKWLRHVVTMVESAVGNAAGPRVQKSDRITAETLRDLTELVVGELEREFPFPGAKPGLSLQERVDRLCELALHTGERVVGIRPEGSILDRIFRLRYWIMDSRYREDIVPEDLPPLTRQAADRRAELAMGVRTYERLADILEYVLISDLDEIGEESDSSPDPHARERLLEYAMNLEDVVNRASGGDVDSRYSPRARTVHLTLGDPIDASEVIREAGSIRAGVVALNTVVEDRLAGLVRNL